MNRTTAKRLLNKKGWTGKEVGLAYLYSLSEQKRARITNKKFKPPFTREDLDRMEQSLTVPEQYFIFYDYAKLYSGLVDGANMAECHVQQLYSGFYRYLYTLKDCIQADKALEAVEKYPLIMTRSQYNRIKAELIADRKAFRTSFFMTLINSIQEWAFNLEEAPEAVREAIETTKQQPCTNTRILENYNKDMGEGYYTLPDGTRSDSMSSEEWQQLLQDRYLETHKLTINGEEASLEETVRHFNTERRLELECIFFEGTEGVKKAFKKKGIKWDKQAFTLEEFLEAIERFLEFNTTSNTNRAIEAALDTLLDSGSSGLIWHDAEEVPELTKFDVLEETELIDYYLNFEIDGGGDFANVTEFKQDYPEVYKAAVQELKKLLPAAAKIKEKDYVQPLFTYGEVQEAGLAIHDYFLNVTNRDILDYYCKEDNTENMQKRLRLMYSGLAIIEEDKDGYSGYSLKDNIAENGDYIDNQQNPYFLLESIDSITDDEDRTEEVEQYREVLVKPAFRYIYAYNALIDALAAVFDADCIRILKKDISTQESQMSGFNGLLYNFYAKLFGTPEEKARKRELIKQVYKPILIEELQPDKKKLQEVKDRIAEAHKKGKAASMVSDLHLLVLEILGDKKGAAEWQN